MKTLVADYIGNECVLDNSPMEEPNGWETGKHPASVPHCLADLPCRERTREVCMQSVKIGGRMLKDVPDDLKTEEMCLAAVRQDGTALEFVPADLKTPEICLAAVRKEGAALRFVSADVRTAVGTWMLDGLESPPANWTPDPLETALGSLMLAAERQHRDVDFVVRPLKRSEHIVVMMLTYDSHGSDEHEVGARYNVHTDSERRKLRLVAPVLRLFADKLEASVGLPEDLRAFGAAAARQAAEDAALAADARRRTMLAGAMRDVRSSWTWFRRLPRDMQTGAVLQTALAGIAWHAARDPEGCRNALRLAPEPLANEFCAAAAGGNGLLLKYLQEERKTPEVCLAAVRNMGYALRYVPEGKRTPEVCLEAVKENAEAMQLVPERFLTPEFCLEAVRQNGRALRFVPERLLTKETCRQAVQTDRESLSILPAGMNAALMQDMLDEEKRNSMDAEDAEDGPGPRP